MAAKRAVAHGMLLLLDLSAAQFAALSFLCTHEVCSVPSALFPQGKEQQLWRRKEVRKTRHKLHVALVVVCRKTAFSRCLKPLRHGYLVLRVLSDGALLGAGFIHALFCGAGNHQVTNLLWLLKIACCVLESSCATCCLGD